MLKCRRVRVQASPGVPNAERAAAYWRRHPLSAGDYDALLKGIPSLVANDEARSASGESTERTPRVRTSADEQKLRRVVRRRKK